MPAKPGLRWITFVAAFVSVACGSNDSDQRRLDDAYEPSADVVAAESLFPADSRLDEVPRDGAVPLVDASDDPGHALPDTTGPTPDLGGAESTVDTGSPSDTFVPVHFCKPGTQFVYVVNQENHLMRFDPIGLTFTDLGQMSCESGWLADTPFSMAIDRQAVAWVLYGDGKLFRVSTDDAACQPANFVSGQHGFTTFGMGFASNSAGSDDETLYVSNAVYGAGTSSLGSLAFPSLVLSEIGPTEAGIGSAELSGNGLGELWAFFPNGSLVAQVDKATGALWPKIPLPAATISDARAWAFATWGGDFYLFFAGQLDSSSSVYRVKKDGTFETLLTDTGWNITGAGVSSCAPTAPTN